MSRDVLNTKISVSEDFFMSRYIHVKVSPIFHGPIQNLTKASTHTKTKTETETDKGSLIRWVST